MLFPNKIDEYESKGERLLFYHFRNDENAQGYYVIHSLFTNYHLNNVSGELDFLVLAPGLGFFAIEVKHGGVERKSGVWQYIDRFGNISTDLKGPFRQVNDTKHSVRNYLLEKTRNKPQLNRRVKAILFGTGVAFTGVNEEFQGIGTDGFNWQVFYQYDFSKPISRYIKKISEGWHNQYSKLPWYDSTYSRPSKKDCDEILQLLRGDFELDYNELNQINENRLLIEEFTREQFDILDIVNFNKRTLIQGQAGTGKTILALELFKRRVKEGKKIAFFCFNKLLAEQIKKSVESKFDRLNYDYFVGHFHSFLSKSVNDRDGVSFGDEYYQNLLPLEFLINQDEKDDLELFDELIIDEAQDLISENYIEVFDSILKDGFKDGNWTMFGDFNYQAIYINDPDRSLKLLSEKAIFTRVPPLKINCRNSEKIAKQNTLLTGVKLPKVHNNVLKGKSVVLEYKAILECKSYILNTINELHDTGIDLSEISILSPKRFENTYLSDSMEIRQLRKEGLIFSTIHAYKGLENTVIILLDFDEITTEQAIKLFYIGISRASQQLFIVLDPVQEPLYKKLIQENISKII